MTGLDGGRINIAACSVGGAVLRGACAGARPVEDSGTVMCCAVLYCTVLYCAVHPREARPVQNSGTALHTMPYSTCHICAVENITAQYYTVLYLPQCMSQCLSLVTLLVPRLLLWPQFRKQLVQFQHTQCTVLYCTVLYCTVLYSTCHNACPSWSPVAAVPEAAGAVPAHAVCARGRRNGCGVLAPHGAQRGLSCRHGRALGHRCCGCRQKVCLNPKPLSLRLNLLRTPV